MFSMLFIRRKKFILLKRVKYKNRQVLLVFFVMMMLVISMKKKLLIIFLALVTGTILALVTLVYFEKPFKEEYLNIYALQTGAYRSYENALKEKEKFESAVILENEGLYLVLVGASTSETGLLKISGVLNKKGINYYQKELQIKESDQEKFWEYNMLLERATKEETILLLNTKILETMVQV